MTATVDQRHAIQRPLQPLESSARELADRQQIIQFTNRLVELALKAEWPAVLDGMEARRRLLQELMSQQHGNDSPELSALNTAVAESERALMRVVAHAIASARRQGDEFAMYN